jgi:ribosomal protein S18 acetylase RimI-like enzyme
MGIVPEAQGQGIGKFLLEDLIAQARARSEKTMALEVFEQNTRAVRLYQGLGFQVVRRLYGYTATGLPGAASGDLHEIDIYEAARMIVCYGGDDLPWQVSGLAIARGGFPDRAYQLGEAAAVISNPMRESLALKALIVPTEFRGHGQATRLLQALFAEFPGKEWVVPAICPEEYGVEFFEKRGFLRQELNQFQMSLSL